MLDNTETEKVLRYLGGNYENYSETNGTTFYYVTRIGDTVISVQADKEYADEIMAFMDEIGY